MSTIYMFMSYFPRVIIFIWSCKSSTFILSSLSSGFSKIFHTLIDYFPKYTFWTNERSWWKLFSLQFFNTDIRLKTESRLCQFDSNNLLNWQLRIIFQHSILMNMYPNWQKKSSCFQLSFFFKVENLTIQLTEKSVFR